jgi:hypothetical protein
MPTNLNALIRYKTINNCLSTGRKYDIFDLIEACSDALSEYCGRETAVSERTVRDDIRVLRSDILGFNAPIVQKEGLYFYSDPQYSIMSVGINDKILISRIIKMLFEIKEKVSHPELEQILNKLLLISPQGGSIPVKEKVVEKLESETFELRENAPKMTKLSEPFSTKLSRVLESADEDMKDFARPVPSPDKTQPLIMWGEILRAAGCPV